MYIYSGSIFALRKLSANHKTLAKIVEVKGLEKLKKCVEEHSFVKEINVYFYGTKNDQGASWCPDCNNAENHVMEAVEKYARPESVFIKVDVGDKPFWKDLKNEFRTDKDVQINVIPTLMRWKSPQRLEKEQCTKSDLLKMFFTDL